MTRLGPYTKEAVGDLGLRLDARGLMPLTEARKRLRAVKTLVRGKNYDIAGQVSSPTDFDYHWAALLSLSDGAEFVREAQRLKWKFSPRGFDNVAPAERYGDAILPWIRDSIGPDGQLPRDPWCLLPCLLVLDSREALEVLLAVKKTRRGEDARGEVDAWLQAHGRNGAKALTQLVQAGHKDAQRVLGAVARRSPSQARRLLTGASAREAARILAVVGSPGALTERRILDVLDAAAASSSDSPMPWPGFEAGFDPAALHAMRLVAARSRRGDDWGLLIEVVQGDILDDGDVRWPAVIQQYTYGSRVRSGGEYQVDARPLHVRVEHGESPKTWNGMRVIAPDKKVLELTDALVRRQRLCPAKRVEFIDLVAIRAVVALRRASLWDDPRNALRKLRLPKDAEVIVDCDRFHHVPGAQDRNSKRKGALPSESETYRSLAQALVARDKKWFDAGVPNNDYQSVARTPHGQWKYVGR